MSLLAEMLADSPTSLWKSDETSGTTAADEQAANVGTYVGGPTLAVAGLVPDAGTAVNYPGNTVHTELTLPGPALGTTGTIVAVFKWSAGTALIRDNTSAGGTGWIIGFDNAGTFAVRIAAGTTISTSKTTAQVRDGNRHTLMVTKSSANVVVYLDGVSIGTSSGAANTASGTPWHVARNGTNNVSGTDWSTATVDYIALFPTALSSGRAVAYTAALSVSDPAVRPGRAHRGLVMRHGRRSR